MCFVRLTLEMGLPQVLLENYSASWHSFQLPLAVCRILPSCFHFFVQTMSITFNLTGIWWRISLQWPALSLPTHEYRAENNSLRMPSEAPWYQLLREARSSFSKSTMNKVVLLTSDVSIAIPNHAAHTGMPAAAEICLKHNQKKCSICRS